MPLSPIEIWSEEPKDTRIASEIYTAFDKRLEHLKIREAYKVGEAAALPRQERWTNEAILAFYRRARRAGWNVEATPTHLLLFELQIPVLALEGIPL